MYIAASVSIVISTKKKKKIIVSIRNVFENLVKVMVQKVQRSLIYLKTWQLYEKLHNE